MADINLIGDDKLQNEGDENGDNFSNTYSTDTKELTSDSDLSDTDLNHNIYDRSYTRSGSRKSIFIIVGLLLIATVLTVWYFLIYSQKDKSKLTESLDTKVVEPEEPTIDIPNELDFTEKPTIEVPVFVKEMINSTQHGVTTVETILATIPKDINFTMIQYRDGNFLVELLGRSASNISNLNNQLQQKFSTGNVKILSRDKKNIKGYVYQQALLNGSISAPGIGTVQLPNYIESNDVKSEFTQDCRQFGMIVKQFDVKSEIRTNDYKKIPVIFRAVGNKDSVLNFLNRLIEKNINVNLSKIVFISSDSNFDSGKINLYLNMEIYHPI